MPLPPMGGGRGQDGILVVLNHPFYAEMGGRKVADHGYLVGGDAEAEGHTGQRPRDNFVHTCELLTARFT